MVRPGGGGGPRRVRARPPTLLVCPVRAQGGVPPTHGTMGGGRGTRQHCGCTRVGPVNKSVGGGAGGRRADRPQVSAGCRQSPIPATRPAAAATGDAGRRLVEATMANRRPPTRSDRVRQGQQRGEKQAGRNGDKTNARAHAERKGRTKAGATRQRCHRHQLVGARDGRRGGKAARTRPPRRPRRASGAARGVGCHRLDSPQPRRSGGPRSGGRGYDSKKKMDVLTLREVPRWLPAPEEV